MSMFFTTLLAVAVVVLVVAYAKKGTVSKNTTKEVSQRITGQNEPRRPQLAFEAFDEYLEMKFDEFIRCLYQDEALLRWERDVQLKRNTNRSTIPCRVYFANGLMDKVKIFCDVQQKMNMEDGSFSLELVLQSDKVQRANRYKPETPSPEPTPVPAPNPAPAEPSNPKPEDIVKKAEAWWNENKDKIVRMDVIKLTADILPEELKANVAEIMLNSGLFSSVVNDEEAVFAEAM